MQRFLHIYRNLLILIGLAESVLAAGLLMMMVFGIVIQVVLRTWFNAPFPWMEEAMTYAFVWLTFLGASIGLKKMRHVKIVAIPSFLPSKARQVCLCLTWGLILWLLSTLIRHLIPIMAIEGSASTVALPIDLPRAVFFSGALFFASLMMLLCVVYYFLADLTRLVGIEIKEETVLRREEELV